MTFLSISWMLYKTIGKIWSSSFNEGHPLRHVGSKAPWQVIQRQDSHPQIMAMPGKHLIEVDFQDFWVSKLEKNAIESGMTLPGVLGLQLVCPHLHIFQNHDDLKSSGDLEYLISILIWLSLIDIFTTLSHLRSPCDFYIIWDSLRMVWILKIGSLSSHLHYPLWQLFPTIHATAKIWGGPFLSIGEMLYY